jgi:hypothetical protein
MHLRMSVNKKRNKLPYRNTMAIANPMTILQQYACSPSKCMVESSIRIGNSSTATAARIRPAPEHIHLLLKGKIRCLSSGIVNIV